MCGFHAQLLTQRFDRCGFTMVEVMVALIIASILASFAIPGFVKTTQTATLRNMNDDFIIFEKLFKNYYINTGDADNTIKVLCPNHPTNFTVLNQVRLNRLNETINANFNLASYDIACRERAGNEVSVRFEYNGSVVNGRGTVTVQTDGSDNIISWDTLCSSKVECP